MSLKGWLQGQYTSRLTSLARLDQQRERAEQQRQKQGRPHVVTWYHRVGDPYSLLLAQLLPDFLKKYPVELVCKTVSAPPRDAQPRPDLWADYAQADSGELAAYHGLILPQHTPAEGAWNAVTQLLLAAEGSDEYLPLAQEFGLRYAQGDSFDVPNEDLTQALRENRAALEQAGHYDSGMLHYEGEWYWGIDRLSWLEERLAALGVGEGTSLPPRQARPFSLEDKTLTCFLSIRSPYSYVALERLIPLVESYDLTLVLKPVLPMVMRGLPVPKSKRTYIVLDTKREAARHGIPFGKICDPLGVGVERVLAVYMEVANSHKGLSFLQQSMRGIWSQALDVSNNRVLRQLTELSGIKWSDAKAAINDQRWRRQVEAHRRELEELGLWGVPSFALGSFVTWGQDRLWMIEEKCRAAGLDKKL